MARLEQDINVKKKDLSIFKVKLEIINELEMRGFGIIEFRTLINSLNEIGLEKNQNLDGTIKKFFDDLKNYVEVIGSRIEIERLKNQRKILEEQIIKEREKYYSHPKVVESITRLAGAGFFEDDFVEIDRILSMNDYYLSKEKTISKDFLIDDLQKYSNLKMAIKHFKDLDIDIKSKKKTRHRPIKKNQFQREKQVKIKF